MKIQSLKKNLVSKIPPTIKVSLKRHVNYFRLLRAEHSDVRRLWRHSTVFAKAETRSQRRGHLVFDYHRIEKGLALPEPRPGFGRETILKLMHDLAVYRQMLGDDDMSVIIHSIFQEYKSVIEKYGISFPEIEAYLLGRPKVEGQGGTLLLSHEQLFAIPSDVASQFIASRRSVRHFTGAPVSRDLIETVVRLAQNAPSVCNRQSARIFCSNERKTIDSVLRHQNGNRGFGHQIGAVLIVTSDVEKFHSLGERNQPFIDGGIFAMSVVTALHAVGLGGCMLNWSVDLGPDQVLRKEFKIPDNHVIITMIGCGYAVDPVRVAMSPRDPLEEVLHWL